MKHHQLITKLANFLLHRDDKISIIDFFINKNFHKDFLSFYSGYDLKSIQFRNLWNLLFQNPTLGRLMLLVFIVGLVDINAFKFMLT